MCIIAAPEGLERLHAAHQEITGHYLLSVPDHKILKTRGQDPCDRNERKGKMI